jgi:hypothetical protein
MVKGRRMEWVKDEWIRKEWMEGIGKGVPPLQVSMAKGSERSRKTCLLIKRYFFFFFFNLDSTLSQLLLFY